MTKEEALKLVQEALEALENISTALREDDVLGSDIELMLNTISKIHAALAQPEEQQSCDNPEQGASLKMQDIVCPNCGDMARTWPKQERPWVGLTKEEIDSALCKYASWYNFAAHLENILKEKNQ